MDKVSNYLILSFLILVSAAQASTKPLDNIDSYGIYVVTENGFARVESYTHDYRLIDFNHINEIPTVERGNESLNLVVYEKNFHPNSIELELRPLDVMGRLQKINFSVKPLESANMFSLTINDPVKDGLILQVRSWSLFKNMMGAIMLGDTQGELVKYFSQKKLPKAPIVAQYLEDALIAFPANSNLRELSEYWKTTAEAEKDKEAYSYVEEKWQQYEQAEKIALKEHYLNAAIVEIYSYLNEHPNGIKTDEAKRRKTIAKEKIKEYEKLL